MALSIILNGRQGIISCVPIKYARWPCLSLRPFSFSSLSQPSKNSNETTIHTCISFLQLFAQESYLYKGKELHSWMLRHNLLTSPSSTTSLINMYSKCKSMSYALSVFQTCQSIRNVYCFNAIISGFVGNGLYNEAFEFYSCMRYLGIIPDKFTFPCAIKGCPEVFEVKKIHGLSFKFGLEVDEFIGSALVNCYLKFGAMNEAYEVFDELPVRDVVLWNAMINGYVHIGEFRMALEVFQKMNEDEAVPNNFTVTGVVSALAMGADLDNGLVIHGFVIKKGYESFLAVSNALIDMYGKCKCIDSAVQIFGLMVERDIFSWNTLLSVHEPSGDHHRTIDIFRRMLSACGRPDLVTIVTVLLACSHLGALMHVKEIHRYMILYGIGSTVDEKDFDNILVNNALLDIYVKCGSMVYAYKLFGKMNVRDVASWNIMIMGYGMHGHGNEGLLMFDSMCAEGIKPDEVTFIGVLSACSHVGLVSHGREYLSQMDSVYGLVPTIEHYVCVIDMLGRAGQLDEAYELLVTMPIECNAVAWRAFLAACTLHGSAYLAEVASKNILELEPEHCGNYVLISNAYGAIGRYEEVSAVRLTMRGQNIKKKPGYSWIKVNNSMHVFVTCDRDHPEANSVYTSLDSLIAPLREHGYVLTI